MSNNFIKTVSSVISNEESLLAFLNNSNNQSYKEASSYIKNSENLFIPISVRNSESITTGKFDDAVGFLYKSKSSGDKILVFYPATTDPDSNISKNPQNPKGTAFLPKGFYKDVWALGRHKGSYEALVQVSPLEIYRTKADVKNTDPSNFTKDKGIFGINYHRAAANMIVKNVGPYSAGCQVIQNPSDFAEFMLYAKKHSKEIGGSVLHPIKYSALLIESSDLIKTKK